MMARLNFLSSPDPRSFNSQSGDINETMRGILGMNEKYES
jgi:hypothetical protein